MRGDSVGAAFESESEAQDEFVYQKTIKTIPHPPSQEALNAYAKAMEEWVKNGSVGSPPSPPQAAPPTYERAGQDYGTNRSAAQAEADLWKPPVCYRRIELRYAYRKMKYYIRPGDPFSKGELQPQIVFKDLIQLRRPGGSPPPGGNPDPERYRWEIKGGYNIDIDEKEISVDLGIKDITIVIGGNTWEDEPATKVGGQTGKKGSKNYAGMLVHLYEVPYGSTNSGGKLIRTTTTDQNGNYRFTLLNPFSKYYVKFTYNGQLYQATKYTDDISGGYSNATENVDPENRAKFNEKFQTINSTPQNYKGANGTKAFPYKQKISKEENAKTFEEVWGGDNGEISPSFRTNAVNQSTLNTNNMKQPSREYSYEPALGYVGGNYGEDVRNYIVDCLISSKTRTYPVYDNFVIEDLTNPPKNRQKANIGPQVFEFLYTQESDQARNVDFGIYRRETSEVRIQKDLYQTRLLVNGKQHIYKYNKRDPENLRNGDWVLTTKVTDREIYQRPIRRSTYLYTAEDTDPNKEIKSLQIFVTYRIHVLNAGMVNLDINEIVDYYDDSQYEFLWAHKDPTSKQSTLNTSKTSTTSNTMGESLTAKGFNKVYLTDKITLTPGQLSDAIYVTFKVKNNENGRVKLDTTTNGKRNIVEVDGYHTAEGIVDTFSNPGNFEASDLDADGNIRKENWIYEPDTDQAPNLKLILSDDDREIKGNVFEDARTENFNSAIIGNGNYGSEDKPINKVKVELVELVQEVDKEGIQVPGKYIGEKVWPEGKNISSGEGDSVSLFNIENSEKLGAGQYIFKNVPPGDFYVRFTYGDNVICNGTVYNGQDYKSTSYQVNMQQKSDYNNILVYRAGYKQDNPSYNDINSLYYYNIAEADLHEANSDAKDMWSDREAINKWSKGSDEDNLLNHRAEELANHKTNQDMIAKTGVIDTEIEYDGLERKMQNENEYDNGGKSKGYVIDNVNLGLVERPRAQLKLNKEITNMKITLANGRVIFDTNQSVNNLYFAKHKGHIITYSGIDNKQLFENGIMLGINSESTPELIQAYMDEELISGAKVEAIYELTVENVGEVDYLEQVFYYTGKGGNTVSRTDAREVIDYVSNLIEFDNKNQIDEWIVRNAGDIIKSKNSDGSESGISIEEDLVNSQYLDRILTYNRLITTEKLSGGLLPKLISNSESSKSTKLVLTKTLANTSGDDEFIYNNLAEIVRTHNDQGRRMQFSISGNQEMSDQSLRTNNADTNAKTSIKVITPEEIDADSAQKIVILPPTGENRNYIPIIITLVSSLLIGIIGIVIIKKILDTK